MVKKEEFKFCPLCGGSVTVLAEKFVRLKCQQCRNTFYLNPKVAVGLLIVIDDSIVLVRRKEEPLRGWWSLPAGYVEYEESCEEAALREAVEEMGVTVALTSVFGVYSYSDDPRAHTVLVVYRASSMSQNFLAGDDAEEVQLFPINQLPRKIAFSGVRRAIKDFVLSTHR